MEVGVTGTQSSRILRFTHNVRLSINISGCKYKRLLIERSEYFYSPCTFPYNGVKFDGIPKYSRNSV